jgi:hypothetical protein
MRRRSVRNRQNLPVFMAKSSGLYGESDIFRHFKSESAMENRVLQQGGLGL